MGTFLLAADTEHSVLSGLPQPGRDLWTRYLWNAWLWDMGSTGTQIIRLATNRANGIVI